MYMSYCRFEGTLQELKACLWDVEDHITGNADYPVRENEIEQFKQMVIWFHDFMLEQELIGEDGEVDMGELEDVCNLMRKGSESEDDEEWLTISTATA